MTSEAEGPNVKHISEAGAGIVPRPILESLAPLHHDEGRQHVATFCPEAPAAVGMQGDGCGHAGLQAGVGMQKLLLLEGRAIKIELDC
jgi:hypothetical protein